MDMVIVRVRKQNGRIEKVLAHMEVNSNTINTSELSVATVINYIENFGYNFFSSYEKSNGYRVKGSKVIVVHESNGDKYIRSVPDDNSDNNLEDIPEF